MNSAFVGGGGERTHSPGGEGGGGSIFWKTRDIGLPSYSNNLSTIDSVGLQAMQSQVPTIVSKKRQNTEKSKYVTPSRNWRNLVN